MSWRHSSLLWFGGPLGILIVVALGLRACMTAHVEFDLVNNSSDAVAMATVDLCGQSRHFRDLEPTTTVHGSFDVICESHYTVTVDFKSGRRVTGDVGYVMAMLDICDTIVVTDTAVELSGRQCP